MPRTINYELGFEQNVFDRYLLRMSGYYKANDDQSNSVSYTNLDETVLYSLWEPLNYDDIRGFELTLRQRRSQWWGGFINYTFQQVKGGNYGRNEMFENRLTQSQYDANSVAHYQNTTVARPFGRISLEVYTPRDYGPQMGGFYPAGQWDIALLGSWRAGAVQSWYGPETGEIPGLSNNVRFRASKNFDLRLTKRFEMFGTRSQFFLDIGNVFNTKYLNYRSGDPAGSDRDWQHYLSSLHYPESTFGEFDDPYLFVYGNDQPGDFREPGTTFVPIELVNKPDQLPANGLPGNAKITAGLPTGLESDRRVLWYVIESGQYHEHRGGSWSQADQDFVKEVLDKKLYIDMPNNQYIRFLTPRRVNMGLRFSF